MRKRASPWTLPNTAPTLLRVSTKFVPVGHSYWGWVPELIIDWLCLQYIILTLGPPPPPRKLWVWQHKHTYLGRYIK